METLTVPALAAKIPTETAAYKYLERLRWKGRPVCPHCGVIDGHYLMKARRQTTTGKVSKRRMWKCHACRKQFSVLVGTIFQGSKIPVRTWLFVLMEMTANKNGIAAREVQRKYGLTPKSAWFLTQRIREVMQRRAPDRLIGTIVADETWIGGHPKLANGTRAKNATMHPVRHVPEKAAVLTLIDRETGEARSRVVPNVRGHNLAAAIAEEVNMVESRLMTDENAAYKPIGRQFGRGHDSVYHNGHEFVRGDVTTNPAESFFSQLKRSLDGTHHAISHEHLHRYLAEFDFRHSTRKLSDTARMDVLVSQARGRRLMYRPLTEAA
jgi:transposase-like protein